MASSSNSNNPTHRSIGFLDLPGELRNMVYREVFERPNAQRRRFDSIGCNLNLLTTCRQVYQEASGLAAKHASFPLSIMIGRNASYIYIYGDGELLAMSTHRMQKPMRRLQFSASMSKLACLSVVVYTDSCPWERSQGRQKRMAEKLNDALLQLKDFLDKRITVLRRLRITIEGHLELGERYLQNTLSPLVAMSGAVERVEWTFTGVTKTMERALLDKALAFRALRDMEANRLKVVKSRPRSLKAPATSDEDMLREYKLLLERAVCDGIVRSATDAELKKVLGMNESLLADAWAMDGEGKMTVALKESKEHSSGQRLLMATIDEAGIERDCVAN